MLWHLETNIYLAKHFFKLHYTHICCWALCPFVLCDPELVGNVEYLSNELAFLVASHLSPLRLVWKPNAQSSTKAERRIMIFDWLLQRTRTRALKILNSKTLNLLKIHASYYIISYIISFGQCNGEIYQLVS